MGELQLVADLVLAVVAAFVGGVIAQRLGQPVILGYLLAGVLIGPFTPGPHADIHSIQVLAEIGVAFLMFALGAEFSFGELRRLGRVATLGGGLQVLCTMGLGPLLAPLQPALGVKECALVSDGPAEIGYCLVAGGTGLLRRVERRRRRRPSLVAERHDDAGA